MLRRLVALGNRLPDPVALFALVALAVALASAALDGVAVTHPGTGEPVAVRTLLDAAGVRRMFTDAVKNFSGFPPLGSVLTVMLGVGFAERVGLVGAAVGGVVGRAPPRLLTLALVLAGVNSAIVSDAGFVVLIPLSAAVYARAGRHPLAGLTVAYAAVSGGYGANLVVTALDPMLAGLTQAGARLVDPEARVAATCNWWFNAASVPLLVALTMPVAAAVERRFGPWKGQAEARQDADPRALRRALAVGVAWVAGVCALAVTVLRDADGGYAPLYDSMVPIVAIGMFLPGLAYGRATGVVRSSADVARHLGDAIAGMGGYIVLAFAAAQFVAWFSWSNLGIVLAVKGADGLRGFELGRATLLVLLVGVSGVVNLVIASASAKWAILAPVFVPMMMLLGVPPAETQAAYRVGDAVTNILTPLLPYIPIVLTTARRYDAEAGLGDVLGAQVPFAVAYGVGWTALVVLWSTMGWSFGPG